MLRPAGGALWGVTMSNEHSKALKGMLLIVGLLLLFLGLAAGASLLFAATPPAGVLVLEGESTVHEPGGNAVTHPANTQSNACRDPNNVVFEYHPASRTMFVPNPCNDLFNDGFE